MLKDTLENYRHERRAFVSSLKLHYGIDFYKLGIEERKNWFAAYLTSKREFMASMIEAVRYEGRRYEFHKKKSNVTTIHLFLSKDCMCLSAFTSFFIAA